MAAKAKDADGERGAMRWVKRGCWVAAWGMWFWLGVGLHRELPRDLSPTTRLGFVWGSETLLGFLEGGDAIAVQGADESIRISDARSGEKIKELPGPDDHPGHSTKFYTRHGVAICRKPGQESERYLLLNLRSGAWSSIEDRLGSVLDVHPTKPWAAGAIIKADRSTPVLAVVDLTNGRTVARWPHQPPPKASVDFALACRFRDDGSDDVLILAERLEVDRKRAKRLVIWNPVEGTVGNDVPLQDAHLEIGSRWGKSGRVALFDWPEGGLGGVSVVDARSGDVSISSRSTPGLIPFGSASTAWSPTAISPSGRTLLSMHDELWDIGERRRIWSPEEFESVEQSNAARGTFLVHEDWNKLVGLTQFRLPYGGITWAVRDMENGALVYRAGRWHPNFNHFSSDGRLGVTDLGDVVSFPLRPNYSLLALCQAILALPLIMLWAALRWRRKRRMRMASVAP